MLCACLFENRVPRTSQSSVLITSVEGECSTRDLTNNLHLQKNRLNELSIARTIGQFETIAQFMQNFRCKAKAKAITNSHFWEIISTRTFGELLFHSQRFSSVV